MIHEGENDAVGSWPSSAAEKDEWRWNKRASAD